MLEESQDFPNQLNFFEELGVDQPIVTQLHANESCKIYDYAEIKQSNVNHATNNNINKQPVNDMHTNIMNTDGYYTEKNYIERANAEDLVDFMTDLTDATIGHSSQEPRTVIVNQLKETVKKKKRFRISRLFINPISGVICLFNALTCWFGLLIAPEYAGFCIIAGLILTPLGIIGIRIGIQDFRKAKQVYDVVYEREEKISGVGEDRNIAKLFINVLIFGTITIVLILVIFFLEGDLSDKISIFLYSCFFALIAFANIVSLVKEISNRFK